MSDDAKEPMTDQTTPQERYFVGVDGSCHYYVVPVSKIDEWRTWRDLPEEDERSWEAPDYATRIDGGEVTFTDWRIERV